MIAKAVRLLAAAGLAATLAACGASASSQGSSGSGGGLAGVTLRVGDQKAGSQVLLTASGELDKLPYKVTWAQFTSGPPLLEAVNAGGVDIGAVGNTPPIFAAAANSKIAVVAADQMNAKSSAVVVPPGSPITATAQLKGRRVAVAKGSSAHYHLLAVLKKDGLSFKDITVSYLQPADALAAFTSGRIDAWAIWDPYTSQAVVQNKARILVDGTGYVNGYNFQVAGRDALADKDKTAAIRDYLARLQRAKIWANTHQDEWAKVWAEETGLPVEVTGPAAANRVTRIVRIDDALVASEQEMADAFGAEGLIPGKIDFAGFADRRFNDLVKKDA
ncbi:ABC transporter substrate-binding protein [Sphaerisporangium krabiense]|uniref:Putative aliphatic sulfonates-binding protein n=1 Tax=Sphaerisporangium krabiense TaxID=763782 RepID=A0A7W8Z896_9ACTN|nr:ABC transporter substrate-binding protein [Sphaerisporangium krabiense]MBB5629268.1 sulfonate transport system substrate-binding protein [Sphaerisporangium krabiense]GII67041.1 ABC transporter substrate-binding protein [Sphaerisporangium krabiense]